MQLGLQHFVHFAGIGLALHLLHHLPDKKAEDFIFTATVLLNLILIVGNDFIDNGFNRGGIGNLFQAFGFDNLIGCRGTLPDFLEHLLGDLAGNGVVADAF